MKKQVSIIGSGFASLSAACYLAKDGYEVTVYEKNAQLGGRARQFVHEGFKFDMGPTWYWMPDVFERFFQDFGRSVDEFYELKKLGPGYRVYFGNEQFLDISDNYQEIVDTFESVEPGAGKKLNAFIQKSEKNYDVAIKKLVYKPGLKATELISKDTIFEGGQFLKSIRSYVHKKFKSPKLRQILEFPVLFLGAKPSQTPLFYNFMNYADFKLGTWYPVGGMRSVVDGIIKLAEELGVKFEVNADVTKVLVKNGKADALVINNTEIKSDVILTGADYHHSEKLLPIENRNYKEKYWDKRMMAPSALLFYVGFDRPIKNVLHHTMFFDQSFDVHAESIYDDPSWPKKPLFYASFPGKTDTSVLPQGKESAIFLVPLAPDLVDNEVIRNQYFNIIMERLEVLTNQSIKSSVLFKHSYCVNDFKDDYNSYKGNAYGLANTLTQTAFLRPKLINKTLNNFFYTGQLTVPGPGVPPALISGKLVSDLISKQHD